MSIEADILAKLKANLDAAIEALERNDMAALEALALHEAQLMDGLRAIWSQR